MLHQESISQAGSKSLVKPFSIIFLSASVLIGGILGIIYYQGIGHILAEVSPESWPVLSHNIQELFLQLYAGLVVLIGMGSWWLVLTRTSHQLAREDLQQAATEIQELADHKELLHNRLSSQIRNSLELETVLSTAVNEIRNLLEIDRCKFLWYQPEIERTQFELNCQASAPTLAIRTSAESELAIAALGELILQYNLLPIENDTHCSSLKINQINNDPQIDERNREQLIALGINCLLAIAIQTNSGKTGIIICEHGSSCHYWNNDTIELLQAIANQLAIAINQAELYHQSLATAAIATAQTEQLSKAIQKLQQAQSQLIQSEKMSSLGQLVAGVAHEINNPVNFIYGNLSHANEYTRDLLYLVRLYQEYYPNPAPEIQDYIADIDFDFLVEDMPKMLDSMKVGAERIRQIVLTLRNFSRLDEAEMKPVNIHEGIDSSLLILQNRLKAKPELPAVKVIKEYGILPAVECYAGQLNQVFMNIINNAIDALIQYNMTRQPEEICRNPSQITIRTEVLNSQYVRVRIADNGPGMSQAVKAKIFDPFFTTKPVDLGTGLGLSISYQIVVEKHGGALNCISNPGQGTEFWIDIPIYQRHPNFNNVSKLSATDTAELVNAK